MGPRAGLNECEKSCPTMILFCCLSFFRVYSFVLFVLASAFVCIVQHKYPFPSRFYFVLHPYLVLCPDCPAFCHLSLLTTHTTQTFMPPAGYEPAVPASDRPQTLPLDRSATGISGFDPRTVQPVARRYTDYAVPGSRKKQHRTLLL